MKHKEMFRILDFCADLAVYAEIESQKPTTFKDDRRLYKQVVKAAKLLSRLSVKMPLSDELEPDDEIDILLHQPESDL